MVDTELARRIRKGLQRQKPPKTQGWLADQLGISRSHLSDILSGRRTPSLTLATKLEEQTGVPIRDFARVA